MNGHGELLPVLGAALVAAVPVVLAILLGILIPLGLAVLMIPLVSGGIQKGCICQWAQTVRRPSTQLGPALL